MYPLDETTATFGGSVQPVQISKVPINGRNWSTLETLVPGAVNLGTGGQSSIRFSGQGMDDANYRLDGNDMTGVQNAAPKSALRLQVSTEAYPGVLGRLRDVYSRVRWQCRWPDKRGIEVRN